MGSKGSRPATTTTQSTQNQNSTWTPPADVLASYRALLSRATTTSQTPYQAYGGDRVAGFSPDQQSAFEQTRGVASAYSPYVQNAAEFGNYGTLPSYQLVQNYMDPYVQNVVDATRNNFAESNAVQQRDLKGNIASAGALGGSRQGVAEAELARTQSLGQDPIIAQLYSQGYQSALNAAQQDALRANSVAAQGQNMGLGLANALYGTGSAQQQLEQAQLNVPYQNYLEQRAYPYEQLNWLAGITSGIGSLTGGTTQGTSTGTSTSQSTPAQPSTLQSVIGGGLGLASLFLKDGGRVPMATGGSPVPGGPRGIIPTSAIASRAPVQASAPTLPAAPAAGLGAAASASSTDNLVNQALGLAGKMKESFNRNPINILPAAASFTPTRVGEIAPSTYGSNMLPPIYARGGRVPMADGGDLRYYENPFLNSILGWVRRNTGDYPGMTIPDRGTPSGEAHPRSSRSYSERTPPSAGVSLSSPASAAVGEPGQTSSLTQQDRTPPQPIAPTRSEEANGITLPEPEPAPPPAPGPISLAPDRQDAGVGIPIRRGPASPPPAPPPSPPPVMNQEGVGRAGGLLNLSPRMRESLLSAGLGIMASRAPTLGQAIGEGGMAGVKAYADAERLSNDLAYKAEGRQIERERLLETMARNRASQANADRRTAAYEYGQRNPPHKTETAAEWERIIDAKVKHIQEADPGISRATAIELAQREAKARGSAFARPSGKLPEPKRPKDLPPTASWSASQGAWFTPGNPPQMVKRGYEGLVSLQ